MVHSDRTSLLSTAKFFNQHKSPQPTRPPRADEQIKGVPTPMNERVAETRSRFSRLHRAAFATLAGAVTISTLGASAAFAQTKNVVAHKKIASHGTPSLATLEKQLKAFERPASSKTPLTEAGSSLLYPLMAEWAPAFPYASSIPVTTAAGGSGKGISSAIAGTVNIGASDAYLPASDTSVINIPVSIAAQMVNYNIPGVSKKVHLKLNSQLLNEIYSGKITNWNDKAIRSLNPGVKLPSLKIVTLHRTDGSGDTFLFSSYLDFGYKASFLRSVGPQTLVNWPNVSGELGENGNTGMLQTCAVTKGCIAYIGVSYLNAATQASGLGEALLRNAAGRYVLPTAATIHNEVLAMKSVPANGSVSLIYLPHVPNGYPIVNFEYAIVAKNQPSAQVAAAIKSYLAWGMDPKGGSVNKYLVPVHFQPLPANGLNVAINLLKSF